MIIVTIAVPLFLLAGEMVQLLFGSRWTTAGTVLRVLALVLPLRGLALIISPFFWGLNRPKQVAVSTALEAVVFLATLSACKNIRSAWRCLGRDDRLCVRMRKPH